MKAKDLMIGDWIKTGHLDYNKVQEIARDESMQWYISFACSATLFRAYEFEPVPLTPEILEKNGFLPSFEMGHETLCLVSSEYSVYYRPVDTYLYVFKRDNEHGEGDFIVSDHRNKNAKYVHELQQALRLCGLDELADNFKI